MYSTVVYIQVIPIGEGVDLVIDCVDVLKTDGRWVLYGLMGMPSYVLLYYVIFIFSTIMFGFPICTILCLYK